MTTGRGTKLERLGAASIWPADYDERRYQLEGRSSYPLSEIRAAQLLLKQIDQVREAASVMKGDLPMHLERKSPALRLVSK